MQGFEISLSLKGRVAFKGESRLTEMLRVGRTLDNATSLGRNEGQELRQGVEEACLRGRQNPVPLSIQKSSRRD